jgi:hypothetical protein
MSKVGKDESIELVGHSLIPGNGVLLLRLLPQRALEGSELCLDIAFDLSTLDDVVPIATQEVINGFHAYADRA